MTICNTTILTMGALVAGMPWLAPQQGWTRAGGLEVPAQVAPVTERAATGAKEAQEVDLAICLDTSGSMEQLLEAAKQRIWAIVNDFALAKPMPRLRVALLSFGNDTHSPENGWVEVLTPLTEDLDLVSQRLFERTTNGGTELVGRVVHRATSDLAWSASPDALKIIVVAGNESADQDREISFRDACARAIGRDILVNAIYCGSPTDEIAPTWREVARLADGQFAAIEHQAGPVVVATPYDDELASLSTLINATYIPLGDEGLMGCSNQWAQDANAESSNTATAATRAQVKGGGLYVASWDLVTACNDQTVQLAEVEPEDLPEELRGKSLEELAQLVAEKTAEREEIQQRIQALGAQRDAFVTAELAKSASDPARSFDFALRQAVRAQAEAKGLCFPAPAASVPTSTDGVDPAQQLAPVSSPGASSNPSDARPARREAQPERAPGPYRRPPGGRG